MLWETGDIFQQTGHIHPSVIIHKKEPFFASQVLSIVIYPFHAMQLARLCLLKPCFVLYFWKCHDAQLWVSFIREGSDMLSPTHPGRFLCSDPIFPLSASLRTLLSNNCKLSCLMMNHFWTYHDDKDNILCSEMGSVSSSEVLCGVFSQPFEQMISDRERCGRCACMY